MIGYYEQNGINAIHFPIHDFNEEDLKQKLFEGAKLLNKMINTDGLNVYVHCTAGMGRAPAVVVIYLCLFNDMLPEDADAYVKKYRNVSVPNMKAIKAVYDQFTSER